MSFRERESSETGLHIVRDETISGSAVPDVSQKPVELSMFNTGRIRQVIISARRGGVNIKVPIDEFGTVIREIEHGRIPQDLPASSPVMSEE